MESYAELLQTLKRYLEETPPNDRVYPLLKQALEAIERLQGFLGENLIQLFGAMKDLSRQADCGCCLYLGDCTNHQVERNLAYGGCTRWRWRGAVVPRENEPALSGTNG